MASYISEYTNSGGGMGMLGHRWLTSSETSSIEGELFCAIQPSEASVITYTDAVTGIEHVAIDVPRGMTIVGKLKDITCISGRLIMYYGQRN